MEQVKFMPPAHVTYNAYMNPYVNAVLNAHESALQNKGSLPDWIINMHGMSGKKYRRMINEIVKKVPNPRYLEVGSWAGSTACSATYGNAVNAFCIDNWSEFNPGGDIQTHFFSNINKVLQEKTKISVLEKDFYSVDFANIGKYNVYLFDGPHEKMDQYKGVELAQPALDDEYILIVDDWNRVKVREGTLDALADLPCDVLFSLEIRTTLDGTDPYFEHSNEKSDWHNGYFFAVVRKK